MSYALISERVHKALKRYRCIWCGEQIPIGAQYVREFSVYDGDVQKHKWHPECKGAAEEFFRENGEDEFSPWENERPLSNAEQEFQSWDCSLLAQDTVADDMDGVAKQYAHKLAMNLECLVLECPPSARFFDEANTTLGEYRSAMNKIHERECPTHMGEPLLKGERSRVRDA